MWQWLEEANVVVGFASALIGLVSAVFAVLAWRKARLIRQQQVETERVRKEPISLILVCESDGREHTLDYRPRRDQAARSEILGILGMYYGPDRFHPAKLVPMLETGDLDRVIAGEASELRLDVSSEDFDRFVDQDAKLGTPARLDLQAD